MKYNKLVRDRIPGIIEKSGKKAITRTLDDEEYKVFLEKKLDEEVAEFHESKSLEELADIVEVLYALAETHGRTVFNLGRMRRRKLFEKGGFTKRICLLEVEE